MHALAATGSSESGGFLAYLVLFALVTLGWAGIPGIGATVLGAATALASQGRLNITAVLVVAVIAVEVGGMAGYSIGVRWGRALLSHPGPLLDRRQRVLTAGEAMYAKWGRLAVFFTPCMVSGIAKMKYSQFVFWTLLAGIPTCSRWASPSTARARSPPASTTWPAWARSSRVSRSAWPPSCSDGATTAAARRGGRRTRRPRGGDAGTGGRR